MRAAIAAAAVVAVGFHLLVAASLSLSPMWTALGVLFIALAASLIMVVADQSELGTAA